MTDTATETKTEEQEVTKKGRKPRKFSYPCRRYAYDCYILSGQEWIDEEIYRYHKYRNNIIRLERDRLEEIDELLSEFGSWVPVPQRQEEFETDLKQMQFGDFNEKYKREFRRIRKKAGRKNPVTEDDYEQYREHLRKLVKKKVDELVEPEETLVSVRERITELKEKIELMYFRLKEYKARKYKKVDISDDQAEKLSEDVKAEKKVLSRLRAAEAELRYQIYTQPEFQRRSKIIEEHYAVKLKKLRSESGLLNSNYTAVEDSFFRKTPDKKPRFRNWDGGQVELSVQVGGGFMAEDVFKPNTFCHVQPVDPRAWDTKPESRLGSYQRRQLSLTTANVRICCRKRKPQLAKVQFRITRPFPPGSYLQYLHVRKFRIADQWKHQLTFVVADPNGFRHDDLATEGLCGINFGWRKVKDGLRVAALYDEDGNVEYLKIPMWLINKFKHHDSLQSVTDKKFNLLQVTMKDFRTIYKRKLPKWFLEETESLHNWKSRRHFYKLLGKWKENRFAHDKLKLEGWDQIVSGFSFDHELDGPANNLFELLSAWVNNDRHLWRWQANELDNAKKARKDMYRKWARKIARKYGTVVVLDMDLRIPAKRARVEDTEDVEIRAARYNNRMACLSSLVEAVKDTCVKMPKLKLKHITQTCSYCDELNSFDAADRIHHTCTNCGRLWDQDVNAARNLLLAQQSLEASATPSKKQKKKKSRSQDAEFDDSGIFDDEDEGDNKSIVV